MLDTGSAVIHPVKSVRDLVVHLDSELMMKTLILKVVSSCYHQFRRICQVRQLVGQDVAQQLVSAFILSLLDYGNSLLSRLSGSTIQPLQRVMNAAAWVVMNLSLRDHVKPALKQLHWLPGWAKSHIQAVSVRAPHPHQTSTTIPVRLCIFSASAASDRYQLRSTGSDVYVLPRTRTRFGERGFLYSGPAAWNTLPSDLHDITDTSTSRKRLKSVVLFDRAYHWLVLALLDMSCSGALQIYIDRLMDWFCLLKLLVGWNCNSVICISLLLHPWWKQCIVISMSVCLSVCPSVCLSVCPRAYLRNHMFVYMLTDGCGSVLFRGIAVHYVLPVCWSGSVYRQMQCK